MTNALLKVYGICEKTGPTIQCWVLEHRIPVLTGCRIVSYVAGEFSTDHM